VVVADENNVFVTILKGGITNGWFSRATPLSKIIEQGGGSDSGTEGEGFAD
jgi:hypothetical protein